ncbi:MAG: hypothetical protein WAM90_12745 [Rhodanobacter sp.]
MQTWIENEILLGFQKLMTLGLDRQPAADLIEGTLLTWVEAVTHGKRWEQDRDTNRIRDAFATLAATCNVWPSPAVFLLAVPPASKQRPVSRLDDEQRRASGLRHIAEICKQLGIER